MTITNTSIQRSIVLTEYIPVQVRAETACNTIDYCSFRKDDTSLLELAFDQTDRMIYRITLVICADYWQAAEEYRLPAEYTKGDLHFHFLLCNLPKRREDHRLRFACL